MGKYKMTLDLNILNHLGLNLYSNTPAVLSEVIANAWDADASEVKIDCDTEKDTISIIDNGIGMTLEDINNKYLCVGYQKREKGEAITPIFKRPVMGRKGIGKLSLLSIADEIRIYSKKGVEQNAFLLSRDAIKREITSNKNVYHPEEIDFKDFSYPNGTKIVITSFKKRINSTSENLRKRLARRFSIIGKNFELILDGNPITIADRDYFKKIQFLWPIANTNCDDFSQFTNINIQNKLDGDILGKYQISGWIGTAEKPSNLEGNNNAISIITRGKLAQEDILSSFNDGGMYSSYLIGEITADFLDEDTQKDISTSNRQQYFEDEERYIMLKDHIIGLLKKIQNQWTNLRKEKATETIISSNPAIKEWYENLRPNNRKYAQRIFATIETMRFDDDESKKKELLKYGILAFERLNISERLHLLEKDENLISDIVKFGEVFTDIEDIEAALYWEIANERVKIIRKLSECCDQNALEKIIQKHIFNNLWLLDPSWDRAVPGTERMEEIVGKEFNIINAQLTEDEKKARIDIRYKSTSKKHIIIELKRYNPTYKVNVFKLKEQIYKYTSALRKCLKNIGQEDEPIETICIIGEGVIPESMSFSYANSVLQPEGRIITYDSIINDALKSYSEYLEREHRVGKIRSLLENL